MKKRLLLTATVAITAFIFIHSLMPADDSQQESDSFFILFEQIMKFLHLPNLFNEGSIRKLAHFIEFSVFGFFLSSTVHAYCGFKNQIFKILFFLLAVPVIDETLQYFSDGRSSAVKDVLLDFSGCLFGLSILFLITVIVSKSTKMQKTVSNNAVKK